MAIPEEDVKRVRAATDIVALIGERSALKREGRRFVGLCPFHAERTPSFSVNPEAGLYYCFGCQASGDAITFVRETEHLDFADAVRLLATRAGITVRDDPREDSRQRRLAPLLQALEAAAVFYHETLLSSEEAGPARRYLRSRGYDGELVRTFRLGWAPDDWDALARHLGVSAEVLSGAGLGFVNRAGRQQDAFRSRVMFPICDPSGKVIAFGGRVLPDQGGGPKYKNSPEGPLYQKRRVLYGLNWAKKEIIATGEVIVCEGYTDVIGCFAAGIRRAVATCGTALGEEHMRLLSNFARRVVLAYDADSAGQAGMGRLYEWERRHQIDVFVASLPEGSDPAEIASRDPSALEAAISEARPYLLFWLERIVLKEEMTSVEGRAKAAEKALAAVAEHPSSLVRDQYVMWVAERCRLEPATLRRRLEELASGPARDGGGGREARDRNDEAARGAVAAAAREAEAARTAARGGAARELIARRTPASASRASFLPRPSLEALGLAIHRRGEVLSYLDAVLFEDPVEREAFLAVSSNEDLHEAISNAGERAGELLRRLAVEEPISEAEGVLVQLVRDAALRALGELQAELRQLGDSPERFRELSEEAGAIRRYLEDLVEATSRGSAFERLLAWLIGRGKGMR